MECPIGMFYLPAVKEVHNESAGQGSEQHESTQHKYCLSSTFTAPGTEWYRGAGELAWAAVADSRQQVAQHAWVTGMCHGVVWAGPVALKRAFWTLRVCTYRLRLELWFYLTCYAAVHSVFSHHSSWL